VKILRNGDQFTGWAGDNPFFLVINTDPGRVMHIIDLDESGWMSEQPGLLREEGEWLLVAKGPDGLEGSTPVLAIRVLPGEQPYCIRRHIGSATSGKEITVPGIGKKRTDGHVDRLWLLPNGIVCSGDDVDIIGANILRSLESV
jgi:hypothetical protein